MNRSWTPPSRVSHVDSGMLIEIELDGISLSTIRTGVEDGRLMVAGEHKDWGPFELQFDIPADHKIAEESFTMTKEVLRIELPRSAEPPPSGMTLPVAGADILMKFPRPMLLYCTGCGKHFDIVLNSQEPSDYQCPSCGAMQQFGLGKFVDNAIKQSQKMLRRKRGRG